MKTLHARRLRIEPLVEFHARLLFEPLRDEELYEFIADRPPESAERLAERYRRLETRTSPDGREAWLNWALWSLPGERYVGWLQTTIHPDRTAHIAYILFRDAWGRGFGREAVTALIQHLQDDWGTTRVLATVDTRNLRSIALLEALGFERGAVREEAEEIRGVMSDEVDYSIALG